MTFTIDLRAMDDAGREAVLYELSARMYNICDRRSVSCVIERKVLKFSNFLNCFYFADNLDSDDFFDIASMMQMLSNAIVN